MGVEMRTRDRNRSASTFQAHTYLVMEWLRKKPTGPEFQVLTWLVDHTSLPPWKFTHDNLLWLSGESGKGKSLSGCPKCFQRFDGDGSLMSHWLKGSCLTVESAFSFTELPVITSTTNFSMEEKSVLYWAKSLKTSEKEKWDAVRLILSQSGKKIPGPHTSPTNLERHMPVQALGNQFRVREVTGFVKHQQVSAFPDSGSSLNIVSKDLVSELGSKINKSGRQLLRLPQGKVWSLGTVSLPFRFKNESTCYPLNFHVMEKCVHSCVLGSKFLKGTQTLTKHLTKRVTSRMVDIASFFRNKVCLLGSSQERLLGSVNGQAVGALADTGAYVNVISRSSAEQLGLEIKDRKDYRAELQFMDGSVTSTSGMALDVEWKFGTTGESPPHRLNFHVLEDLPCDLILCEDFLFENDVFSVYEDLFYDDIPESKILVEIAFIGFLVEVSKKSRTLKGRRSAITYQGIHEALQSTGQNISERIDELPQVQTQPQAQADGSHGEPGTCSNANGQGQTPDSNAAQNLPRQKHRRIHLLFANYEGLSA